MTGAALTGATGTRWCQGYIRIPFADRGVTREACDCYGLVALILREQCGIDLPDYLSIPAGASLSKLRAILAGTESPDWLSVEDREARAFDVVLMRGVIEHDSRRHARPIHIGCVVKPGTLIHIETGAGVSIVDYRRDHRVKNRVHGFYRYAK